jgi:hypothetical protein
VCREKAGDHREREERKISINRLYTMHELMHNNVLEMENDKERGESNKESEKEAEREWQIERDREG